MTITITNTTCIAEEILAMIRDGETDPRLPELQHQLAVAFGERNGWRLSKQYFALSELATLGTEEDIRRTYRLRYLDHPCYFREGQRPAAIAAHLYKGRSSNEEIAAFAARLGIVAEAIADFPSWYYPSATRLVLYRRKAV